MPGDIRFVPALLAPTQDLTHRALDQRNQSCVTFGVSSVPQSVDLRLNAEDDDFHRRAARPGAWRR